MKYRFRTMLVLAALLGCGVATEAAIIPMGEDFEAAALGLLVEIDSGPGTDERGTAGAKPIPATSFSLMQAGGATPGTGQVTARIVNDAIAAHGNVTSNPTQYLEVSVPARTSDTGSLAAHVYTAFPGNPDGEAYIMKADIYNPNNVVPRMAAVGDISPGFSNFGWLSNNTTHSRMFDTNPNADWQTWWMVVNDTGSALNYVDPNGAVASIAAQSTHWWIDGVQGNFGSQNMGTNSAELMGLSTGATTSGGATFTFWADNFSIVAIPEPSTLALLAIGGLALGVRRRVAHGRPR